MAAIIFEGKPIDGIITELSGKDANTPARQRDILAKADKATKKYTYQVVGAEVRAWTNAYRE